MNSEKKFLRSLGKQLLWHIPFPQIQDILTDYEEYFSAGKERHTASDTLAADCGTPKNVARDLLSENGSAGKLQYWMLAILSLVVLLSACFWCAFLAPAVFPYLLILTTTALFFLLRIREQLLLEMRYPPEKAFKWLPSALHLLLLISAVLLSAGYWLAVYGAFRIPDSRLGATVNLFCMAVFWIAVVLVVGAFLKSVTESTGFCLICFHGCGTACFAWQLSLLLHSLDSPVGIEAFMSCLIFYLLGLVISGIFYCYFMLLKKKGEVLWTRK